MGEAPPSEGRPPGTYKISNSEKTQWSLLFHMLSFHMQGVHVEKMSKDDFLSSPVLVSSGTTPVDLLLSTNWVNWLCLQQRGQSIPFMREHPVLLTASWTGKENHTINFPSGIQLQ